MSHKENFIEFLYKRGKAQLVNKTFYSMISSYAKKHIPPIDSCFFILGVLVGIIIGYLSIPKTRPIIFWTIVGAVLGTIFGLSVQYIQKAYSEYRKQSLYGRLLGPIHEKGSKCTIFITEYWRDKTKGNLFNYNKSKEVIGTNRLMGTGDSTALPYIYGLLISAGKLYDDIEFIKSYRDFENKWTNNFISVGGLTNRATEQLMKYYKDKLPYFFDKTGSLLVKKYGDDYKSLRGDPENDYGLIMKITGLNYEHSVLFVIAGIEDLGTTGAAYYLFENARKIVKRYGDGDFALIIGVKRGIGEKSAFEVDFEEKSVPLVVQLEGAKRKWK